MNEQVVEGTEQADDPDETSEEDTDEQPEIEEDEFADVDLDAVAERAEEEAGADADDADETSEEDTDEQDESGAESTDTSGESWGDMYVGTLTTLSNAAIEEHGKADAEKIDESLARQLHLDEYMDDLMAKHGKREEMPPEQALLLSTSMFLVLVLGTKTELPSKVLEEFDF